jgi:phospholipase C
MKAMAIVVGCILLIGCSQHGVVAGIRHMTSTGVAARHAAGAGLIQHVVIIIQENRSFDNLFNGYPGADTAQSGIDKSGNVIPLVGRPLWSPVDVGHDHSGFVKSYDGGQLDGFGLAKQRPAPGYTPIPNLAFSYTNQQDVQSYWQMASQYVVADRMFQSNWGPSFPAHQYLIAAQSIAIDDPHFSLGGNHSWGCDSPAGTYVDALDGQGNHYVYGFPCFSYATIADEMDAAGVAWRYYTAFKGFQWNAFDAIDQIRYGPDWTPNIYSGTRFKPQADFAACDMAQVTFVVPAGANSDHAGNASGDTGPAWVSSMVNAIGQGACWNSTAIFITWDDWGGWYDHVAPPQIYPDGLGFRVPLIVVSPYAKHGYVSHNQYEFGSILRYTEETFGLAPLSVRDSASDDMSDAFDYTQSPSVFQPFARGIYNTTDTTPPDND